jgi:hypothetical protein
MLEIREEQMAVFDQAARKSFEDEMVQHLAEFVPKQCEVIGEQQVRKVIQLGVERARIYSLTNRGPVRFYIELMFVFGSDFDTDPLLSWAAEILGDVLTNQMAKAGRLYEKTNDYLEKVSGPRKQSS